MRARSIRAGVRRGTGSRTPPRARSRALTTLLLSLLAAGCGADDVVPGSDAAARPDATDPLDGEDMTPDLVPDGGSVDVAEPAPLAVGGAARVTAASLNLRTGAGTSNAIIAAMPCGALVMITGGPTMGWWNVRYGTQTGWASGAYLVADSAFDPSVCGGAVADGGSSSDAGDAGPASDGGASMPAELATIIERARWGVGYSYYWGHGSWRTDDTMHGACSGSCPSCTHTGPYGADCSGFVAKAWQIPAPSAVTTDQHPYSTYTFYNSNLHWRRVPRANLQPGDALVYNANGHGHIMLFESGTDPWGSIWTYEARACATGIVHNLRVADSTYVAIRREGL